MSTYLSISIGGVVAIIGIAGVIGWLPDLLAVIRGTLPLVFLFGGAIAVIAGISEMRDEAAAQKEAKK